MLGHEMGHLAARRSAAGKNVFFEASAVTASLNLLGLFFSSWSGVACLAAAITSTAAVRRALLWRQPKDLPRYKERSNKNVSVLFGELGALSVAVATGNLPIAAAYAVNKGAMFTYGLVKGAYCRSREFQADRISVSLSGDPDSACLALSKMAAFNHRVAVAEGVVSPAPTLLDKTHQRAKMFLMGTHPSNARRFKAIHRCAPKSC